MNWLTAPLTIYALLAAIVIGTLVLFVSTRIQQAQAQRKLAKRCQQLEDEIVACRTMLAQGPAAAPTSNAAIPARSLEPKDSGMSSFKRQRALALYDEGQPADRIAADLGLPKNQVELLAKVRRASALA